MQRTFEGRAAAAPVVLPLAMVAPRLSISRRHGTNWRGRLRLHRTCHVQVDKLPTLNFDFRLNSTDSFGKKNCLSRIIMNISRTSFVFIFHNEKAKRRPALIGVKFGRVQRGLKMCFLSVFQLLAFGRGTNERQQQGAIAKQLTRSCVCDEARSSSSSVWPGPAYPWSAQT